MTRIVPWVLLSLAVALAGCAALGRDHRTGSRAEASMVGMTETQLLRCAGKPRDRRKRGGGEIWTYETGGGQINGGNGLEPYNAPSPVPSRYCVARVYFEKGRVTRTEFSGFTGGLFTHGDQCERLLAECRVSGGQ